MFDHIILLRIIDTNWSAIGLALKNEHIFFIEHCVIVFIFWSYPNDAPGNINSFQKYNMIEHTLKPNCDP